MAIKKRRKPLSKAIRDKIARGVAKVSGPTSGFDDRKPEPKKPKKPKTPDAPTGRRRRGSSIPDPTALNKGAPLAKAKPREIPNRQSVAHKTGADYTPNITERGRTDRTPRREERTIQDLNRDQLIRGLDYHKQRGNTEAYNRLKDELKARDTMEAQEKNVGRMHANEELLAKVQANLTSREERDREAAQLKAQREKLARDTRKAEAAAILESRGVDTSEFTDIDPDLLKEARKRIPELTKADNEARASRKATRDADAAKKAQYEYNKAEAAAILESRGQDISDYKGIDPDLLDQARARLPELEAREKARIAAKRGDVDTPDTPDAAPRANDADTTPNTQAREITPPKPVGNNTVDGGGHQASEKYLTEVRSDKGYGKNLDKLKERLASNPDQAEKFNTAYDKARQRAETDHGDPATNRHAQREELRLRTLGEDAGLFTTSKQDDQDTYTPEVADTGDLMHPTTGGKKISETDAAEEMYGTGSPQHEKAKANAAKRKAEQPEQAEQAPDRSAAQANARDRAQRKATRKTAEHKARTDEARRKAREAREAKQAEQAEQAPQAPAAPTVSNEEGRRRAAARQEFADMADEDIAEELDGIRAAWGDDIDNPNADMGTDQEMFDTDRARASALEDEMAMRDMDDATAPQFDNGNTPNVDNADTPDYSDDDLARMEADLDARESGPLDVGTKSMAELEDQLTREDITDEDVTAITEQMEKIEPWRRGGILEGSLTYDTIRPLKAKIKKFDTTNSRGFNDADDKDYKLKLAAAAAGNENFRRYVTLTDEFEEWQSGLMSVQEASFAEGNSGTYVNDLRGEHMNFNDLVINDLSVTKMREELRDHINRNIGFLPNAANFQRIQRGERPLPYNPEGARELGGMGGRANKGRTKADREFEKLRADNERQRKAATKANAERPFTQVDGLPDGVGVRDGRKAINWPDLEVDGKRDPKHVEQHAKSLSDKDLDTAIAHAEEDKSKYLGGDPIVKAYQDEKARRANPDTAGQDAAGQDTLDVTAPQREFGARGQQVNDVDAAEEMYGTNSPEHHRAKVQAAKDTHGENSPEHQQAIAAASKPRPKDPEPVDEGPKGEQGTLAGIEDTARASAAGDTELPGLDAVALKNPTPKKPAPKAAPTVDREKAKAEVAAKGKDFKAKARQKRQQDRATAVKEATAKKAPARAPAKAPDAAPAKRDNTPTPEKDRVVRLVEDSKGVRAVHTPISKSGDKRRRDNALRHDNKIAETRDKANKAYADHGADSPEFHAADANDRKARHERAQDRLASEREVMDELQRNGGTQTQKKTQTDRIRRAMTDEERTRKEFEAAAKRRDDAAKKRKNDSGGGGGGGGRGGNRPDGDGMDGGGLPDGAGLPDLPGGDKPAGGQASYSAVRKAVIAKNGRKLNGADKLKDMPDVELAAAKAKAEELQGKNPNSPQHKAVVEAVDAELARRGTDAPKAPEANVLERAIVKAKGKDFKAEARKNRRKATAERVAAASKPADKPATKPSDSQADDFAYSEVSEGMRTTTGAWRKTPNLSNVSDDDLVRANKVNEAMAKKGGYVDEVNRMMVAIAEEQARRASATKSASPDDLTDNDRKVLAKAYPMKGGRRGPNIESGLHVGKLDDAELETLSKIRDRLPDHHGDIIDAEIKRRKDTTPEAKAPEATPKATPKEGTGTPSGSDAGDTRKVAEFLASDEGKAMFRKQYNTYNDGEYPSDSARADALRDVASFAAGRDDLGAYESLQDNFKWAAIAKTKDPDKIDKYLRGVFEVPDDAPEPTPEPTPKGTVAQRAKQATADIDAKLYKASEKFLDVRREHTAGTPEFESAERAYLELAHEAAQQRLDFEKAELKRRQDKGLAIAGQQRRVAAAQKKLEQAQRGTNWLKQVDKARADSEAKRARRAEAEKKREAVEKNREEAIHKRKTPEEKIAEARTLWEEEKIQPRKEHDTKEFAAERVNTTVKELGQFAPEKVNDSNEHKWRQVMHDMDRVAEFTEDEGDKATAQSIEAIASRIREAVQDVALGRKPGKASKPAGAPKPEGKINPVTGKTTKVAGRAASTDAEKKLVADANDPNRDNEHYQEAAKRRAKAKRELSAKGIDDRSPERARQDKAIEDAQVAYKPYKSETDPKNPGLYFREDGAWGPISDTSFEHMREDKLDRLHTTDKGEVVHVTGIAHRYKNGSVDLEGTNLTTGEPWKAKLKTREGLPTRERFSPAKTPQQHHAREGLDGKYPRSEGYNRRYEAKEADNLADIKREMAEAHIKNNPADAELPDITDAQAREYARKEWEKREATRKAKAKPGGFSEIKPNGHTGGQRSASGHHAIKHDGKIYNPAARLDAFTREGEPNPALFEDDVMVHHYGTLFKPTSVKQFKKHYRIDGRTDDGKDMSIKVERSHEWDTGTIEVAHPYVRDNGEPMTEMEVAELLSNRDRWAELSDVVHTPIDRLNADREKKALNKRDAEIRAGKAAPAPRTKPAEEDTKPTAKLDLEPEVNYPASSWNEPYSPDERYVVWNGKNPLEGSYTWQGANRNGKYYAAVEKDSDRLPQYAKANAGAKRLGVLADKDSIDRSMGQAPAARAKNKQEEVDDIDRLLQSINDAKAGGDTLGQDDAQASRTLTGADISPEAARPGDTVTTPYGDEQIIGIGENVVTTTVDGKRDKGYTFGWGDISKLTKAGNLNDPRTGTDHYNITAGGVGGHAPQPTPKKPVDPMSPGTFYTRKQLTERGWTKAEIDKEIGTFDEIARRYKQVDENGEMFHNIRTHLFNRDRVHLAEKRIGKNVDAPAGKSAAPTPPASNADEWVPYHRRPLAQRTKDVFDDFVVDGGIARQELVEKALLGGKLGEVIRKWRAEGWMEWESDLGGDPDKDRIVPTKLGIEKSKARQKRAQAKAAKAAKTATPRSWEGSAELASARKELAKLDGVERDGDVFRVKADGTVVAPYDSSNDPGVKFQITDPDGKTRGLETLDDVMDDIKSIQSRNGGASTAKAEKPVDPTAGYVLDPKNPQPREGRKGLAIEDLPRGSGRAVTAKGRTMVREHAKTLDHKDLIQAYKEALATTREKGGQTAARNAYSAEAEERRLFRYRDSGTKIVDQPMDTPAKWGMGSEAEWLAKEYIPTREEDLNQMAKNYSLALQKYHGMTKEEADARVARERKAKGSKDPFNSGGSTPDVGAPTPEAKAPARHKKGEAFTADHLEEGEALNDSGSIQRGDFKIIPDKEGYRIMEGFDKERLSVVYKRTLARVRQRVDAMQKQRDANK